MSVAASSAALRTPTFASSSSTPWKARSAMRMETVKPIPAIVPAAATDAQPTGGRRRPRLRRVASQVAADDPDRLADHVAEQNPKRHAGGVGGREKAAAQVDAGVGEREERDDRVARPGMPERSAAARSARRPSSARRAPSGRGRRLVARGRAGRGRSRARGRSSAPGMRARSGLPSGRPQPDRRRTCRARPRPPCPSRSRPARNGCRRRGSARMQPNRPNATMSAETEIELLYAIAITRSATTSSTTATVSRNARSRSGSPVPTSAIRPSANAVSVDIAVPQPCAELWPALNAR